MKEILKGILIVLLIGMSSCAKDKITPKRGKVKYETVHIAPKIAGRLEKVYVGEGDYVEKGDTLAKISIPELEGKKMQAEGAVKAASAQLQMAYNGATIEQVNQIDGKLEAAQSQLKFMQETLSRIKNMYKDSLVPKQKYDEVYMKYKMAEAQVKAIEAKKKEVVKGTRKEVIAQAKGQLQRAKGALKEVQTAEKEQYIIAPVSFRIEDISLGLGELVTPGYTLVTGLNPSEIYFRFSIPESQIYTYKNGEMLLVSNPFNHKEVKAKIYYIKQLPRYADITSPASSYKLTESTYELRLHPVEKINPDDWMNQSTVLIK